MDSTLFTDTLLGLLDGDIDKREAWDIAEHTVRTFNDAGVLTTTNDGLVVCLADGTEFQVTVVRSR